MSQSKLQQHIAKKPNLYADHEIKDEMVRRPVVLQTVDIAPKPENNSMGLLKNIQIKLEPVGVVKEEHIAEKVDLYANHEIKDELVIRPGVLQTVGIARKPENNSVGLLKNIQIKLEPVGVVKVEHIAVEVDLYADHEIKDEMVVRPVVLQTVDIARKPENNSVGLLKNIQIKHEPVGVVKEEHIAEKVDLYASHEIKNEMVIGPVVFEIPDVTEANCMPNTSDNLNIGTQPYKCDICSKCFIKKQELNQHIISHGQKPYKCDLCNKCFVTKQSLNHHIIRHTNEKPYKCDICNKCFIKKQELNHHKMRHTGEKPNKCDICNKCFLTKHELNHHIMSHTGEKPYKCDICNKCFVRKQSRNRHRMTHTGEKPYKCDICNKHLITKQSLNRHTMRHTREKQYKCDICNKCFTTKQFLNHHNKRHTTEKPYKCDTCNKCFITTQSLNWHIMGHTGEKPYKCDICNKCFVIKHSLNRHIMRHTGEKPYKCNICNKCFITKHHLNYHRMTHIEDISAINVL